MAPHPTPHARYPHRARLKLLSHASVEAARQQPELVAQFTEPETQSIVERIVLIAVVSFDWNCPKYIPPRYTAPEMEKAIAPLKARIAGLAALLSRNH